jgi:hypothetical protein
VLRNEVAELRNKHPCYRGVPGACACASSTMILTAQRLARRYPRPLQGCSARAAAVAVRVGCPGGRLGRRVLAHGALPVLHALPAPPALLVRATRACEHGVRSEGLHGLPARSLSFSLVVLPASFRPQCPPRSSAERRYSVCLRIISTWRGLWRVSDAPRGGRRPVLQIVDADAGWRLYRMAPHGFSARRNGLSDGTCHNYRLFKLVHRCCDRAFCP